MLLPEGGHFSAAKGKQREGRGTDSSSPSFQPFRVMMYAAGPGSGDSPEGFPEQPRLQPQIGNYTAQALGTETGSICSPSFLTVWLG